MIHNIAVVDGQEYKAVKPIKPFSCKSCTGDRDSKVCKILRQYCCGDDRFDRLSAIYKPHYKLKHK